MLSTTTLTLAQFLLDRIAEDETAACAAVPAVTGGPTVTINIERHSSTDARALARYLHRASPRRTLAECAVKRRIVKMYAAPDPHDRGEDCPDCRLIRLLAAPYADHPDYRNEWRI